MKHRPYQDGSPCKGPMELLCFKIRLNPFKYHETNKIQVHQATRKLPEQACNMN